MQPKVQLLKSTHVYDDVTDFGLSTFIKNTKMYITCERKIISSSNTKIHSLYINSYHILKYDFLVEVTFNVFIIKREKCPSVTLQCRYVTNLPY